MAWFFGYLGQSYIPTRYMATKDEEKCWSSTAIGMTWGDYKPMECSFNWYCKFSII